MITAFLQLETAHEQAFISPAHQHSGYSNCEPLAGQYPGLGRWLKYAVGAAAQSDFTIGRGGPVAKIIAVIIIIVTGLSLAFGDTSGGFRRLVQIVFGLSIAFAASSFFLSFFSFGGGVVI
ncbi:hypothetical protein ABIC07_008365 [Bradyrhizobium sp. RT9a]